VGSFFNTLIEFLYEQCSDHMAENIPNIPAGAIPPKKETGKVQPKKETVRINLPPKPSAAPTIKMPTLPPGGPTGAGSAPIAAAAPPGAPAVGGAPAAPRLSTAAPVAPPRPVTAARSAPAAAPTVSGFDTVLAIATAVVGLLAVGTVIYLIMIPT
jgi:hypothetical protein